VNGVTTLDVVHQAEVFTSLFDRNDVHESSGVGVVCANLSIHLDVTLHEDGTNFLSSQGVLQAVAEENDEGKGFAKFVRTSTRTRSLEGISNGESLDVPKFRSTCLTSSAWEH